MYLVRALRHGCWAQQALLSDAIPGVNATMRPYPSTVSISSLSAATCQEVRPYPSTSQRFAKTYTLPSTDSVGDPSAFWEKKMFQRFDRMDFNKDGFICWRDFDSQMKYMLVSHHHDEKTMAKITTLFEDAWRRVWSFGVRLKDMRVSKREFVHGYTHIIKRAEARRSLSATLEDLLGGCFDIFDATLHGERTGRMSKQEFVAYQMCWNITAEEAEQLFREITPMSEPPATHVTREQYLHAAWDFYFHMNESKSIGKSFFGTLRKKKLHLLM